MTARRLSKLAASVLFALALSTLHPTGADAADKWGPFRGRIVDVDTGAPIPGVAVLVVWYELVPNPVQTNQRFYDAREARTDADGRFKISRRTPPILDVHMRLAGLTYFAPGYVVHREVIKPVTGRRFVDPTEIQMKKLKTLQELRRKSRSRPTMVPDDKMPHFIEAINAERRMLELEPIGPARRQDR